MRYGMNGLIERIKLAMNGRRQDRSHNRAEGMTQSSISMDAALLKRISAIAEKEKRSRNKQMEVFLASQVAEYEKANGPAVDQQA